MANQFDPAQFVDMETDQELVRRPPLPVGDYTAMIGDIQCVPWTSAEKGTSGIRYTVPLKIQIPPDVKAELGLTMDTITLTDSIMLDQNEQGGLDFGVGKNGYLRRYREALGQNVPGEKWSARRMVGQPLTVKISHDLYKGEVQERIAGVAKAG